MAKVLKFRKSNGEAVRIEHPEIGGTFLIRPMTFEEGTKWTEIISKQDFERDNGRILFNPKNGQPVKRYAADVKEQIDFAASLLEGVEDIECEDGQPFEPTKENLRELLTLMGTSDIEHEVDIDKDGNEIDATKFSSIEEYRAVKAGTKKVMKPTRENLYTWVTRTSALLAGERNKVAKGN